MDRTPEIHQKSCKLVQALGDISWGRCRCHCRDRCRCLWRDRCRCHFHYIRHLHFLISPSRQILLPYFCSGQLLSIELPLIFLSYLRLLASTKLLRSFWKCYPNRWSNHPLHACYLLLLCFSLKASLQYPLHFTKPQTIHWSKISPRDTEKRSQIYSHPSVSVWDKSNLFPPKCECVG